MQKTHENNDQLDGLAGDDTYNFTGSFGGDIVLDAEGSGGLWVDGVQLTGGKLLPDNVWESSDNKYRFTLMGGNLIVGRGTQAGADTMKGTITVQGNDWSRGNDNLRCKSSTRARRSCFKKHSGLRNGYGGYRPVFHKKKSISSELIPSLVPRMQRAARSEGLQ